MWHLEQQPKPSPNHGAAVLCWCAGFAWYLQGEQEQRLYYDHDRVKAMTLEDVTNLADKLIANRKQLGGAGIAGMRGKRTRTGRGAGLLQGVAVLLLPVAATMCFHSCVCFLGVC